MRLITWNLNARTNKKDLTEQCDYLQKGDFDVITLQEVLLGSEGFIKEYFSNKSVLSSFDLVKDKSVLVNKRRYGQIIISNGSISEIKEFASVPFPERVLSCSTLNFEVHTTHVPPGSSNGVRKVEHFEGLYKFLSNRNTQNLILTGDFNSPKQELMTGEVITWAQKVNSSGKVRIAINSKWRDECTGERWDLAERNVIKSHTNLDLKDAFRYKHGYKKESFSWFTNKGVGRRYDHIFCSSGIDVADAFYDQTPRIRKISDHSPLIATLKV